MKDNILSTLRAGGIVILRTDTLYGILACASDQAAVERIYSIKDRQSKKPFIQLISRPEQTFGDAALFGEYAARYADTPTSLIIESPEAPSYLLRNGTSLGYRLEQDGLLYELIEQLGPLVAPSANPEGLPPARTINEARTYFGDAIDMYIDGGEVPLDTQPSRLIKVHPDGRTEQLR